MNGILILFLAMLGLAGAAGAGRGKEPEKEVKAPAPEPLKQPTLDEAEKAAEVRFATSKAAEITEGAEHLPPETEPEAETYEMIDPVTHRYRCPYCPQTFETYKLLNEHITASHKAVTAGGQAPSEVVKALEERPPDYTQTTYNGNQAWVKTLFGTEVMWVLQPDGIQLYKGGKKQGAFGTSGFYEKGTWKYLAILAHLLADLEGYHLSEKQFEIRVQMYLAGNLKNIGEKALKYIELAESY